MAVQVVLALLGEELHRAQEPLPRADSPDELRVADAGVQKVRLPPQLGGGVGVGVGEQGEPVQTGEPPVHGRVRGETRLHGVDLPREVVKALLHRVEAREGPEEGEMGRPDVGRDELRLRTDL